MNAPPSPPPDTTSPPQANFPLPSAPAPSPQKKRLGGCAIALLILGGLVLLGALIAAFFALRFATSPNGKKAVAAFETGIKDVRQASHAPGTNELRAIGCADAMVMDTTQVDAIMKAIADAGVGLVNAPTDIVCRAPPGGPIPTCDQVAATYLAAVGGRARGTWFQVSVVVSRQGGGCKSRYTPDGKPL